MTTFYFIRHGETEWNHQDNRYCGLTDVPLNVSGFKQSDDVAKVLAAIPFDRGFTSELQRAQQTMRAITTFHQGMTIQVDARLNEIDFGNWEGIPFEKITAQASWQRWINNENDRNIRAGEVGESAFDVFQRGVNFLTAINEQYPHETVAIVSHNTFIRLLITGILEAPWGNYRRIKQKNTGITCIHWEKGSGIIHKING